MGKNKKSVQQLSKHAKKRMIALPCREALGAGYKNESFIYDTETHKFAYVSIDGRTFNDLVPAVQMNTVSNATWCNSKAQAKAAYYA